MLTWNGIIAMILLLWEEAIAIAEAGEAAMVTATMGKAVVTMVATSGAAAAATTNVGETEDGAEV